MEIRKIKLNTAPLKHIGDTSPPHIKILIPPENQPTLNQYLFFNKFDFVKDH